MATQHQAADSPQLTQFWQQPFAQHVLPLIASLATHAGLIILVLCTYQAVAAVMRPPLREQRNIPESQWLGVGKDGSLGDGTDITRRFAQDLDSSVLPQATGFAATPGPLRQLPLFGGGHGDMRDASVTIGLGPLEAGNGTGMGSGSGSGVGFCGGGGPPAPFGPPGGGPAGSGRFIRNPNGTARRIVFVCDASGSMLNMSDSLRIELRKSIQALPPTVSFNVIFFQDKGCSAVDRKELLIATPQNKERAIALIDQTIPRGETDPLPALELAFPLKPDLIHLLTDGDFNGPGNDAVVAYCRKKAAEGKARISTIAFVPAESRDNPGELEYVKALKMIAKDSGGQFSHVSDGEFGAR